MKKVIFGAGYLGSKMLETIGEENVAFFIDNDVEKQNKMYCGKMVYGVDKIKDSEGKYEIEISTVANRLNIQKQLVSLGITNFSIVNRPYSFYTSCNAEAEKIESNDGLIIVDRRKKIKKEVAQYLENQPLFQLIAIETINRCNNTCAFCPANCNTKTMERQVMTFELYKNIIDQLSDLKYEGPVGLFCNNEPFLDDKIVQRAKYAREKLEKAHIYLFSNGLILTPEKLEEIYPYLDEIQVNNYGKEPELNQSTEKLLHYCEQHGYLKEKFIINIRNINDVLTSRAGTSPNRVQKVSYPDDTCVLPFRQMIVRPDGKLSLCCCDALGKNTLGDLTKETLLEAWYGEKYKHLRECISKGRRNWGSCLYCDSFIVL